MVEYSYIPCARHIRKVHGIVLSASSDIITIVDFGLTATKSQKNNKISESENLEDMVNQEDKAMVDACEQYRKDNVGKERINILTLSGEKEINRWKKVNYGEELKKQKDWRWWKKSDDRTSTIDDGKNAKSEVDNHLTKGVDSKSIEKEEDGHEASEISKLDETQNKDLLTKRPTKWWKGCKTHDKDDEDRDKPTREVEQQLEKNHNVPTLPKSDPEHLVLSRVRYLLHNPAELPPHNILFSNSECIAVWCKTGRWSTLQASIFLYSTAAGNLKTMVLGSTGVATATTTITAPATGIAGWFGLTTTTTVSLLSVQPWLIPLLAGYGLIAVGTPIILAMKAKEKWERATEQLNDGFWGNAESDVYVEAIKSWSGLE